MRRLKQRKNFLKITDPKINKLFWWVCAALFAIAAIVFTIIIAELVSLHCADDAFVLSSLFPGFNPFVNSLFGVFIILFLVFMTIVIYNYITNKENDRAAKPKIEVESPLLGAAKEHQEQIIELLKSVAMPAPNKSTISHAKTAKFIHALIAQQLIDSNRDSKLLMAWIEQTTNYPVGQTRAFNQALKNVKINDPDVQKYHEQIAQIIDE